MDRKQCWAKHSRVTQGWPLLLSTRTSCSGISQPPQTALSAQEPTGDISHSSHHRSRQVHPPVLLCWSRSIRVSGGSHLGCCRTPCAWLVSSKCACPVVHCLLAMGRPQPEKPNIFTLLSPVSKCLALELMSNGFTKALAPGWSMDNACRFYALQISCR